MAKKGGRGPQRPVRGFRPGKEPVELKRRRAKSQLSGDATWAQKQTVDAIAGRSRAEVSAMVRKWSTGLAVAGVVVAVGGAFLYGWSWIAGGSVHAVAGVLFFLAYRIRKQGPGLAEMADTLR